MVSDHTQPHGSPVGGAEGKGEEVQEGTDYKGSSAEVNVALEDDQQSGEEGCTGEKGLLVLLLLVEVKVVMHGLEGAGSRVRGECEGS